MTRKETIIVLLSITFCWSSSYIFIKDLSAEFSVFAYLALTSGLAGIVLWLALHKAMRGISRKTLISCFILSFLIAGNIGFEKLALDHLDASAVSALASMNVILVPVILTLRKKYPSRNNVAGVIIIIAGLLVSGHIRASGDLIGLVYIFLSCLMMSLYTVAAADYAKEIEPLVLTVLQLCMTAVIGAVLWLVTEGPSGLKLKLNEELISYLVIIAFFSKAYAYFMLMYAEKYADAVMVTVIAATEPIVTLSLAVLMPEMAGNPEVFSPRSLAGDFIIFAGAVVAGTGFLSPQKGEKASGPGVPEPAPAPAETAAARQSRRYPLKAFFGVFLLFFALGAAVRVMEFADGYSSLRPVNFITVPVGLLFGPFGAAGCALGNLCMDLWREEDLIFVTGCFVNFMGAYLPYKVWKAAKGDRVCCHTWKEIGLYTWASLLSSLCCGVFVSAGLELVDGAWFAEGAKGIFWNNFGFSMMFGLASFIVLTLNDPPLGSLVCTCRPRCGLRVLEGLSRKSLAFYAADTVLLGNCMILMRTDRHWQNNFLFRVLVIVTGAVVVLSALIPSPEREQAAPGTISEP